LSEAAVTVSEAAVSYALEQLEPSDPPPRDAAARELAQAVADAEGIREQARSDGFAEGRAAGQVQGQAEIATAIAALREAADGLEALRVEVSDEVERDAVELALALAGKVIVATLQVRPELVVEVLQGALRRVSGQRSIAIVVNPADLETIRSSLGELREQTAAVERWDLQPDARVQAGGAIVRTVEGEVDACVATQLERAHEVVLSELGPRRGKSS
jgi:flagellar assembly protein FliH